jgi:hypothetical protein
MLIGRVTKIEKWDDGYGNESFDLELNVKRPSKDYNGNYWEDTIPMVCHIGGVADYIKVGKTVGVKGHIECMDGEIVLEGEKIMFVEGVR